MHEERLPFDLAELSRRIDEERERRQMTMTALAQQVGVAASTIRRFRTATDAEADGVLAVISWLGDPPEDFMDGSSEGVPLAPAGSGQIRVDMSLVLDKSSSRRRTQTRTTIQRLALEAQNSGRSVASLTRWSQH